MHPNDTLTDDFIRFCEVYKRHSPAFSLTGINNFGLDYNFLNTKLNDKILNIIGFRQSGKTLFLILYTLWKTIQKKCNILYFVPNNAIAFDISNIMSRILYSFRYYYLSYECYNKNIGLSNGSYIYFMSGKALNENYLEFDIDTLIIDDLNWHNSTYITDDFLNDIYNKNNVKQLITSLFVDGQLSNTLSFV